MGSVPGVWDRQSTMRVIKSVPCEIWVVHFFRPFSPRAKNISRDSDQNFTPDPQSWVPGVQDKSCCKEILHGRLWGLTSDCRYWMSGLVGLLIAMFFAHLRKVLIPNPDPTKLVPHPNSASIMHISSNSGKNCTRQEKFSHETASP